MRFAAPFATIFFSLAAIVEGSPAIRAAQDVYSPHIISPHVGTIWTAGQVETVTWDASDAPENISNRAMVELNGATIRVFLVKDFDLRSGSVNVTVPDVAPGEYTITLFGDSGNISPTFTIVEGSN